MIALKVPTLEADLGIQVYASKGRGIGGRIRNFPEDFLVEEILTDGSKASIQLADKIALPSGRGRYLVCVLIKKGWDNLVAVREIAKQIGVSPERISIAGIKDARAVTAQHISVGGIPPRRVLTAKLKDVSVHPVRFSSEKISSKLLFGNQFNITVRSTSCDSGTIRGRVEKIRSELRELGGIPNFFGHQRFGTVRPVTHRVGGYLVKEDFEAAALVFLSQPSPHEHPEARKARELISETRDFKSALRLFPRRLLYERLMLSHLSRYPRDFLGAFRRLPLRMRRFFVEAYQSYIFNRSLSERMKNGIPISKAEIGDYIADLDRAGLPTDMSRTVQAGDVWKVNEETVGGKVAIFLPLIGFQQPPSGGAQGEIEKEILEEEGISPEAFYIEKIPEASARGGLRRALAPVLDLDIEEKDEVADTDGHSLKLSFTLHKGAYATVLLREFMKPRDLIAAGF